MSKYGSIVPEDIASNSFDFHGASIEIETDSDAFGNEYQPKWGFFAKGHYGVTNTIPPPHFVGIKSNIPLIVDQYDFTSNWDFVYMTAKDYNIESSMDGETWDTLYSGIIPSTNFYTQKCEFEPVICKYIRFIVSSTYDRRGYKWLQGKNFKIYGTLAGDMLYINQHAYGIPK